MRNFFLKTNRMGFSQWEENDGELARQLWGDPEVTRWICASGRFRPDEITARLQKEIENGRKYQVQYWPVFLLDSGEFAGCCGLRPYTPGWYELGFHLRPKFWRQGYAAEAAAAAIQYAFDTLGAEGLFAGHNPHNTASKRVLERLGFRYVRDEYYGPTGLYHPSYELRSNRQTE